MHVASITRRTAGVVLSLAIPCTAAAQYSGGSGTARDPYQIATAADLIALGETPDDYDKHFILTADIDLDPNLPGRKVFDRAVIAPDVNDVPYPWGYNPFDGILFEGVFDGNGHTVSHLTIEGGGFLGLFGRLGPGAELSDLRLEALDVKGTGDCLGGLVASNAGSISTCYSGGTVSGEHDVGGLVGTNWNADIDTSYSTVTVSGYRVVGGLVGSNYLDANISTCHSTGAVSGNLGVGGLVGGNFYDANISMCYSTGTVSGDYRFVGGLVGCNQANISMCYSTGAVDGNDDVGGLVGGNSSYYELGNPPFIGRIADSYSVSVVSGNRNVGGLAGANYEFNGVEASIVRSYSVGSVTGSEEVGGLVGYGLYAQMCFWDMQASGQTTSTGGMGLTTAEMQTASTFLDAGWDFVGEAKNGPNDVWKIVEGQTYPLLSWQKYGGGTGEPNDPYLLYTAEHLNALGAEPNDYDKHFKLMGDIDLSGYIYDRAVIAPDAKDGNYYEWGGNAIFDGTPFTGVFDGNDHIIRNADVNMPGSDFAGLFGHLGIGGQIRNLGVQDISVVGHAHVGGLVGSSEGSIASTYSTSTVHGGEYVGGLVGYSDGGSITSSYSTASVSGDWGVGGLVGCNRSRFSGNYHGGLITWSHTTSTVHGVWDVGGLAGLNNGIISTSHSGGSVDGENSVGGLVGRNFRDVVNCYSNAVVCGNESVGGLAGENDFSISLPDHGTIRDCYSMGSVTGETAVGGLVGRDVSIGPITSSFWDIKTSKQDTSAGGAGLTTAEMQTTSTFLEAGWDFIGETDNGTEDIWWIDEGQDYPRLWWELEDDNMTN